MLDDQIYVQEKEGKVEILLAYVMTLQITKIQHRQKVLYVVCGYRHFAGSNDT